ncbi:twin-arginine translocase TatA/TatE family subunit [Candidatus Ozemobacteraceae bacterium]|nr:twin-arginine translocase TatA/TatE family subunit [Candidatus Ozemobacteraceae bacterium]
MGLNLSELIVILIIILILFGPGKLPEIGKAIGRGIREFKKAQSGLTDDEEKPENNTDKKA